MLDEDDDKNNMSKRGSFCLLHPLFEKWSFKKIVALKRLKNVCLPKAEGTIHQVNRPQSSNQ